MNIAKTMLLAVLGLAASTAMAHAACELPKIEAFLQDRAFKLGADDKIALYADRLHRYFDKGATSRQGVLEAMRAWEQRWPERIYRFVRVDEFTETDTRDACRVSFTYKFIAYDPDRDRTSAGVGDAVLVIAESGPDRALRIVAEWGDVRCRGLQAFERGRC